MGKNISIYCTEETLDKIDAIMEKWHKQDVEDNWHPEFKRSRSDVISYALSLLFEKENLNVE